MALQALRPLIGSSLRTRVLLLVVAMLALVAVPAWIGFTHVVNETVLRFGTMIAEKQVLYDRYRGLDALNREMTLARTLARSPALIAWLKQEGDPELRAQGLAEMELYRNSFSDKTVFIINDFSGNYYYNDAQNSYGDDPFRYAVRSDNPRDGWYFATRALREGCIPNVDHDDVLRVTKVWINCIAVDEGQILGIVGTGLDLSSFIREVVDVAQPGIQSMFVDQSGAVQAHRDASLVDFHSITKDIEDKTTVFSLLDSQTDRALLRAMMTAVALGGDSVQTAFLSIGGHRYLVGVGFLGGIGWYNISVMDMDAIVDRSLFVPIGVLIAALLVGIALLLSWMFRFVVLDRLALVERGLVAVREGRRATMEADRRDDEIGRLSRTLIEMSDTITEARISLESQVRERTEQLESLVNLDALTGIFNRRGFSAAFDRHRERAVKQGWSNGLLLFDIDHFKTVNDTDGHAAGDQVVVEVARRLALAVRHSDVCGRWGGDEFIVLLRDCDATGLRQVAGALRDMMRLMPITLADGQRLMVTVSIGAVLLSPEDTLDMAADMADAALYTAKDRGRDCVVVFDPEDIAVPQPSEALLLDTGLATDDDEAVTDTDADAPDSDAAPETDAEDQAKVMA